MKIISVNVGQPTALQVGERTVVTGIRKHPVPGRVRVDEQGLEGDRIMNRRYHGGPDQAVYVYTREDYDAWEERLGRTLEPGAFGENVLISGAESAEVRIGERFTLGEVVLEATAPRIPCGTLGARMEDAGFVKRFVQVRRPGFYARVLTPGEIGKGDPVTRIPAPDGAPSIGELFDADFAKDRDPAALRAWLAFPLGQRQRKDVEKWLAKGEGV
ncbi:MOSC domain-containing protein [Deinococcus wulumuqiensis]|uniref:Molybdenum cofactor biosysynthesis protein n=1 Tax=Deinococcus wulumuqiensis TaxID=980427 RepID=A0AAV4K2D9_9DEIO|nr:MOSC domain-containing protein [Deinococcus wulumuqiensis]QII19639.1 MOSC domain-containing protein [Deinococcus wulumuqiensis R12]GGI70409.1 molybdenum cofactor biosysynthesis protein [Deinococcus wulumuqiensis]GGP29585.1 molybdenum cofactor biosysynthesis protein [Deinococcus wulumuqiensis]